jgi:hypothetical protein
MAIFTKQQFESRVRSKVGYVGLSSRLTETRAFSKTSSTTSIFLSHSHKDRPIVEQAKMFFQNLGLSIYVDWADETMPEKTNGVTASKIKTKIKENDKFILVGTNDAVVSRWCNWEVGIGDTYKFAADKICILPLADNNEHWDGNEYLQIYPRIEESDFFKDIYRVLYPNGNSITLNDWLKK